MPDERSARLSKGATPDGAARAPRWVRLGLALLVYTIAIYGLEIGCIVHGVLPHGLDLPVGDTGWHGPCDVVLYVLTLPTSAVFTFLERGCYYYGVWLYYPLLGPFINAVALASVFAAVRRFAQPPNVRAAGR